MSSFTFLGFVLLLCGLVRLSTAAKRSFGGSNNNSIGLPCSIRVPTRSMNTETAPLTVSSPQVCATTASKFALSVDGITMAGQTRFLESRQIGNGKSPPCVTDTPQPFELTKYQTLAELPPLSGLNIDLFAVNRISGTVGSDSLPCSGVLAIEETSIKKGGPAGAAQSRFYFDQLVRRTSFLCSRFTFVMNRALHFR